jgi:hypothetical protein
MAVVVVAVVVVAVVAFVVEAEVVEIEKAFGKMDLNSFAAAGEREQL